MGLLISEMFVTCVSLSLSWFEHSGAVSRPLSLSLLPPVLRATSLCRFEPIPTPALCPQPTCGPGLLPRADHPDGLAPELPVSAHLSFAGKSSCPGCSVDLPAGLGRHWPSAAPPVLTHTSSCVPIACVQNSNSLQPPALD